MALISTRSTIHIDNLLTGDGNYFYVQSFNTILGNVIFTSTVQYLFKSYGVLWDFSGDDYDGLINNTYKITYYQTNTNPWSYNLGSYYPSYNIELISSNKVTLKSNVDVYLLLTNNYHAVTAQLELPSTLSNSQIVRFKDVSGYLGTTSVTVSSTNTNTIDFNNSVTLSTNSISKTYLYVGTGSNGTLLTI